MKEMVDNKTTKPTFVVIFASLVMDLMAFTLILPLMPSILDYYSINDQSGLFAWIESKVELSQHWLGSPREFNKVLFGGLIGSWFSLLQYITQPIVGSLSDIYGRKPVLLLCLTGISISYFFWSLSSQLFTIFLISRTIGGLSKGNISLSTAVITDVSNESNRGKGMALIGISFSVGFIIGPVLGATFAVWSRSADAQHFFQLWPALFALTLSLINVIFIWRYFRESLPTNRRVFISVIKCYFLLINIYFQRKARSLGSGLKQALDYMSPLSLFSFRPVMDIKDFDLLVLKRGSRVYFLFLYLYSGLEFTLTFLTHLRFNYSSAQQGRLYLFAGLLMTLIQGSFVRRIKPGNELKTVFFVTTVVPCLTTTISSYGPPDQKGVILGIFRSLGALARALGPVSASL
ncbi:unnamed protein product, partial [Medioppia subpectinata]